MDRGDQHALWIFKDGAPVITTPPPARNGFSARLRLILRPFFDHPSGEGKDLLMSNSDFQSAQIMPTIQSGSTLGAGLIFMPEARGIEPMLQDVCHCLLETKAGIDLLSVLDHAPWFITVHHAEDRQLQVDLKSKILSLPNDHMAASAIIRSPYFRHRLILSFLQGLRFIERAERFSTPPLLSPSASLLWGRLRTADSCAVMMHLAYELSSVFPDIWHHARAMDDGDMVGVKTGAITDDGIDMACVFHAWFSHPGRVSTADRQSLCQMDARLRDDADPSRYRRALSRATIRSYTQGFFGHSYLPRSLGAMTLDDVDPIHRAYLDQIEREQHVIQCGAVLVRDRDLAGRLFGV